MLAYVAKVRSQNLTVSMVIATRALGSAARKSIYIKIKMKKN